MLSRTTIKTSIRWHGYIIMDEKSTITLDDNTRPQRNVWRWHDNNQNSTNSWIKYRFSDANRMENRTAQTSTTKIINKKTSSSTESNKLNTVISNLTPIAGAPFQLTTNESSNRVETQPRASVARAGTRRTLSAVPGAALPGEEAEGTVPRVLELTVRHPRVLLLSLPAQHHEPLDAMQNQRGRLSSAATKWSPPTSAANRGEGTEDGRREVTASLTCRGRRHGGWVEAGARKT
jgi:hypothetical protein